MSASLRIKRHMHARYGIANTERNEQNFVRDMECTKTRRNFT